MAQGWGSRRLWAFVGLAILLAYAAWIGTPYLRSVVVRDAGHYLETPRQRRSTAFSQASRCMSATASEQTG